MFFHLMTRVLSIVAVAAAASNALAADPQLEAAEEEAFRQAVALVEPSIVRIQTVGGLDVVGQVLAGTGPTTGVVVSEDGYIISSAFNFASKPSSILVELPDGRRLPAQLVATDRSKMLTLIKVEAQDLTPVAAAEKDSVKVGQWAIALGRTFDGSMPSISVGIVSALNRIWGRAIQTDAKVSPVNYGGPLVNIEGKALGILVPLSPQATGETAGVEWYDGGIAFAIPMEDVYAAVERLKSGEDLKPGLLGINFKGTKLLADEPKIDRVRTDSPADKAGFKPGDVITEIDGRPIRRQSDVQYALGPKYAGDTLAVTAKRGDETITKEVTLVAELAAWEPGFLGILPQRPGADEESAPGVGVRFVYPDSPAAQAGLERRDRIVRFNDQEVADAAALADLVSRIRPGGKAALVFRRGDQEQTAEVTLAAVPDQVPGELPSFTIPPGPAERPADAPKTGRFTVEMPAHNHSYWAYVPEDYNPGYQYGLMVWLHPAGDTMEAEIIREWKSICDRRGLMIIGPKAENLRGWAPAEAEFVKDAVEEFRKRYPVDPERVFLHSFSSGGSFAWQLAFKYRDLFRGLAGVATPLRAVPSENEPNQPLQFHFVSGEKDAQHRVMQMTVEALRKLKYPVSFTTLKDLEQKYPPAEAVREMGRWADGLDRI